MNNYKRQKFIEYIPWNEQIIYIPCISCVCCLLQILFEIDYYAFLNFITQINWLVMLEISKKKIQKYYKAQMQEIVAAVVARGDNIQQYIREFNQQQKQTYSYIQIIVIVSMIQLVSMYLIYNDTLSNNNLLEFSTNSILALFIYLSCKHFRAKYEITESVFPQVYVLQLTLILLSMIIANYLTSRMTDQLSIISLYFALFSSALYCCYTFYRYDLSSRKSFGYLMVGGILVFLSQSLNGVVGVQRREMNDLKGSACILYQGGYFLSYLSVLLHAKAYNDHFLLQVRMKYNI